MGRTRGTGVQPAMWGLIALVLVAAGYFAWDYANDRGVFDGEVVESTVPSIPDLPPVTQTPNGSMPQTASSSATSGSPVMDFGRELLSGLEIRYNIMAWNSQMGLIFGNGGPRTREGSLMAEFGVTNLHIMREDDVDQQAANIMSCAQEMQSTGRDDCQEGSHFVAVMGDGTGAFIEGINSNLSRLGEEYEVRIVGSAGFSRGEDQFMASPAVFDDPQAARGIVVATFVRDGDWNIVMKWAADNGIPNNPDATTYDPNAINWVEAEDFLVAVQLYNSEYCETRDEVRNGRRTGREVEACVDAVGTWTPGDVQTLPQHGGRGGLVTIASTRPDQYGNQMPNAIIGIKGWMSAHKPAVAGMLAAILAAGQELKNSDASLRQAADLSAVVYDEEDGAYWYRYFNIQHEVDPTTGREVQLGGSYVNNWYDVERLFGLDGGTNIFGLTYTYFGRVVSEQYPDVVGPMQPAEVVFDTQYLLAARDLLEARGYLSEGQASRPETINFEAASPVARIVSQRSYNIEFRSGSAEFSRDAEVELQELLSSVAIASGLTVEIHGHTDNTGTREGNDRLSEERAFAVSEWLQAQSPSSFPTGRIRVIAHGQEVPIARNNTESGRAQNRRVEIILRMATQGS